MKTIKSIFSEFLEGIQAVISQTKEEIEKLTDPIDEPIDEPIDDPIDEPIDDPIDKITPPVLQLFPKSHPFKLPSGAKFYQNVSYGNDSRNVLDIMLPKSSKPTGLVIMTHGGGFIFENKEFFYAGQPAKAIQMLLASGVAVASINYRYLDKKETVGIRKCIKDQERSIQFLRYYADYFNLKKENVCLAGASAGAGLAFLVGTNFDQANPNSHDLIERESTAVKGIVGLEVQGGYDPLTWGNTIFKSLKKVLPQSKIESLIGQQEIQQAFGAENFSDLTNPEFSKYRSEVDLYELKNVSPEIYIFSSLTGTNTPTNPREIYHHPLHAKTLQENAIASGANVKALIPRLAINTAGSEDFMRFMIRIVK